MDYSKMNNDMSDEQYERLNKVAMERHMQSHFDEEYPQDIDESHLLSRDFLLGYNASIHPTHAEIIEDMQMALKLSQKGSLLEKIALKTLTDYWHLHNLTY